MNKLNPKKFALSFLLFLFTAVGFAQKNNVVGKVTDQASKPLAGATITVKGTTVVAIASSTGEFAISVPTGKKVLVVSNVGYDDKEVTVSSGVVNVSLKETISSLNDVVVTGYTAQKKKDIAGAVSVVSVKDMKQQPVGTGEEALQGRVSGVQVISSGQPGAASDIRIRGISGFGNNAPLVIVDGVRSSITDLNMNDIESIQVLKDASAAIYGVAGSNGVILVTTKRGKAGKAKVTFESYYGVTSAGKGYDMANTQQEANAIWQQQKNSGITTPSDKQFGTGASPVIPDYITPYGTMAGGKGTDPSLYDINSNQITKANKIGTNWYKEITRDAPTQSHTVSVSSGSDKNSYFFSLGYLNQQGIAKYQYLERYSLRANTSFTVKEHIRIGENAYLTYKKNPQFSNQSEGSPFTTAFRESALIPVYDIMGNFAGTKSQGLGNARNPFADIYRTKDNVGNNWNMGGNVWGEVDLSKHLTFRTNFGGSLNNNYYYYFNYVGYENAEGNMGANSFNEGSAYNTNWTYTNTLNYNNTFKNKHVVNFLVGKEDVYSAGRSLSGGRSSYFSENPDFWTLATGSPTGQSNTGSAYKVALSSWISRAEYSYDGKYIVNASLRQDGSSVFAEGHRYGYFPGVSAAWRISQEKFMQKYDFINDMKIRASYAKMGSTSNVDPTNPYNLYASRSGKSFYDINGTSNVPMSGFYKSNIGNTATTWEGDIISNVGIDATMFNNKLEFSIDYYQKKVSGLLFPASGAQYDVMFVGDASLPKVNIGDMQNTGIDLNLTYHTKLTSDIKMDITGMLTSYNNKIVSIPGLPYFYGPQIRNIQPTINKVGEAVGAFYGYKVLGLFQTDAEAAASNQPGAQAGLFKYQDVNKDGKIDADDRTIIGNPNPKFTYGFNVALTYKAFDMSAFFYGSYGNDIFNNTKIFTDFPDFFKGGFSRAAATNSWTPTNTKTSIPKLMTSGSFSSDLVSNSYFIEDGSYLRLRQIQFGYTLPQKSLDKLGIDRLRVYVQGANLLTFTKYGGLDPELQSSDIRNTVGFGIDQGNYPHTPSFIVGVNVNF